MIVIKKFYEANMANRIILDAGHGGYDNGAVYFGRMEKYDNLDLTLAVGEILDNNGVDVLFTRVEDVYVSPLERAYMANMEEADYFVSIHRNSSPIPNTYSGVQSLVYNMNDPAALMAENINKELEEVGFTNLGIAVRTDLAVLRRTDMPSLLVEVGFINTDSDNTLFDERFDDIANAIAAGIMDTLEMEGTDNSEETDNQDETNTPDGTDNSDGANTSDRTNETRNNRGTNTPGNEDSEVDMDFEAGENEREQPVYHIQLGLFRELSNANNLVNNLMQTGLNADVMKQGDLYAVITGEFSDLDEAVLAAGDLRQQGYSTLIVRNGKK